MIYNGDSMVNEWNNGRFVMKWVSLLCDGSYHLNSNFYCLIWSIGRNINSIINIQKIQ